MDCLILVLSLFTVFNSVHSVFGFLPSFESTRGRPDFTHARITEDGIYKAVADVIIEKVKPGTYHTNSHTDKVKEYFKSDNLGFLHFEKVVEYIVDRVNLAQRQYGTDASRTMNCEQILSGNLLLQSLKFRIIQTSQAPSTDWGPVRGLLGEYLFTIQEFYSNTNWVEMFGNVSCRELGTKDQLPLKISTEKEATCFSCNYSKDALLASSCARNLVQNRQLTSGYTSDQNIVKPFQNFPADTGKCSPPLRKDIPATIKSDPGLSPHYHLHQTAGQAAVQATYDVMVGKDTGLLSIIGLDKTLSLLGMDYKNPCYSCLSPSLSVVFVIDDTGSMSQEILETSTRSISIVNQAQTSTAPFNYILSTFNDPETSLFVTTSGEEMKKQLQSLRANGGGDCPEMALHGMINAMKIAQPGSCVFFFTDADAKDPELLPDVIQLINTRGLRLLQFLRGNCSSPASSGGSHHLTRRSAFNNHDVQCIPNEKTSNRHAGRRKRNSRSVFEKIALDTFAHTIHTSHSTIGDTFGQIIQQNMHIQTLGVNSFDMVGDAQSFPVDPCLSLFTVKLEGYGCSNVALVRPDGSNQAFAGKSSKDIIDGKTTILSVHSPSSGMWQIKNLDKKHCHVTISGSGSIDFTYKIMEDIRGLKYPISGTSPVAAHFSELSVSVKGIPTNFTMRTNITEIYLKKSDGQLISSLLVTDSSGGTTRSVFTEVTLLEPFYIGIKGMIGSETMTREDQHIVTPMRGTIEFVPSSDQLLYNQKITVSVRVTNAGISQQTFELSATDTEGFLTDATKQVTLSGNQTKTVDFHLIAIPNATHTKLTVTLGIEGAISKIEKYLMVAAVNPPEIRVTNRSENCEKENMNTYNCSHQNWEADISVFFSANMTGLYSVSSEVTFTYQQDSRDKNKYLATVKGNCCTYQTSVTAVDSAGNRKTVPINFSGETKFTIGINGRSKRTNKRKLQSKSSSFTPWIAIGSGIAAAVALGAAVLAVKKYKSLQNKVDSDFPDIISDQMQNSNSNSDKNRRKIFTSF
ncbi:von Willebrand factor A domain-containing protein 7-like [Saccostrea cucullata]|uniref:von Willebrand factor A domain-containing protein 7-like n=1 Tax=Saccostrea cuccullata TaxID=36930 RepID=UPI002ED4C4DA